MEHHLGSLAENPETAGCLHETVLAELVADKGYRSNETLHSLAGMEIRSYVSAVERGRRRWATR